MLNKLPTDRNTRQLICDCINLCEKWSPGHLESALKAETPYLASVRLKDLYAVLGQQPTEDAVDDPLELVMDFRKYLERDRKELIGLRRLQQERDMSMLLPPVYRIQNETVRGLGRGDHGYELFRLLHKDLTAISAGLGSQQARDAEKLLDHLFSAQHRLRRE